MFFVLLFPGPCCSFESVRSPHPAEQGPVYIACGLPLLVPSPQSLHQGRVVLKNSMSSLDLLGRPDEAGISFSVGGFPTLTIVTLHSTPLCLHKAGKEKSCPG